MEEKLYDITKACKMLNTTSRTLRFYEEKGLLSSTSVPYSIRRHYTEAQLEQARYILALRALGLSVRTIRQLRTQNGDLKEALLLHRAEIYASIDQKIREINWLEDALHRLQDPEASAAQAPQVELAVQTEDRIRIADNCTQALLKGDYEAFRDALSPRMQDYLPTDALRCQMEDILSPLGAFCKLGTTLTDSKLPNVMHCYVEYERMGLDLQYVFHGEQICGFWAHYYLIGGAV